MTIARTQNRFEIDFLSPDSSQIEVADIAMQLARIPRFNGGTLFPYYVAQHCMHVSEILERENPGNTFLPLWGLLHDAHEAYTGDIVSPFQAAIRAVLQRCEIKDPIGILQKRLDMAICGAFKISYAQVMKYRPIVKHADMVACATEVDQLREPGETFEGMPEPDKKRLRQDHHIDIERAFVERFFDLMSAYHMERSYPEERDLSVTM